MPPVRRLTELLLVRRGALGLPVVRPGRRGALELPTELQLVRHRARELATVLGPVRRRALEQPGAVVLVRRGVAELLAVLRLLMTPLVRREPAGGARRLRGPVLGVAARALMALRLLMAQPVRRKLVGGARRTRGLVLGVAARELAAGVRSALLLQVVPAPEPRVAAALGLQVAAEPLERRLRREDRLRLVLTARGLGITAPLQLRAAGAGDPRTSAGPTLRRAVAGVRSGPQLRETGRAPYRKSLRLMPLR